ncbi:MFS transporter [Verrucomicrobiaceae bacterium 227]
MKTSPVVPPVPWALAWKLAVGQLLVWGLLYYSFTVIIDPIQAETGWSRSFLNGGLSLGLLVWGVSSLPVGAWIQRKGGREVMAAGCLVGGLSLIALASVSHPSLYLLTWIGLGLAMGALLYDPAFAVVTQNFGPRYREGITLVTLLGGLASTAFIPLIYFTEAQLGWRGTLQSGGLLLILVGVPLHGLAIPRRARPALPKSAEIVAPLRQLRGWFHTLAQEVRQGRFLGLMLWFTAYIGAFSGLTFLIIPLLKAMSVEDAVILKAIVLIGPMQVLGRLLLATQGRHFSSLQVGRWAMGFLLASLLILLCLPPSIFWLCTFAVLFGMGNGVMTIIKGTAPAELFGTARYSEINGALASPGVLSKALAPSLLADLWGTGLDPKWVLVGILLLLLLGSLALEALIRHEKRPQ